MNKSTKTTIGSIAGIIIGAVIYQLIGHFMFPAPSIDQQLMKVADELNKNCPIMVDKETRLDNTVAGVGKTLAYNYTLVNLAKEDLDIDGMKASLWPILVNNVKYHEEMKTFRENDVTLKYYYKDREGIFVLSLEITPSDYKN